MLLAGRFALTISRSVRVVDKLLRHRRVWFAGRWLGSWTFPTCNLLFEIGRPTVIPIIRRYRADTEKVAIGETRIALREFKLSKAAPRRSASHMTLRGCP